MENIRYTTFEEKVRSMSSKEIIMAMVDGLKKPTVRVDFNTYGEFEIKTRLFGLISREICYGCAATNTICRISDVTLRGDNIKYVEDRAKAVNSDSYFLLNFEYAINCLRKGSIDWYNMYASKYAFATIKKAAEIPYLSNENYSEGLESYIRLANMQI